MSTITTINASDQITNSRTVINTNFSNLNTDKIETSVIDTDTALAANSDSKIPSQKAVKAYVDGSASGNASTTQRGVAEEATQAEVDAGTATGSTGARLFINPSTSTTKFATTQVFSGTAPTSFTDLDLSSTVGAKQRVVLIKITCSTAGGTIYTFRRNGDSASYSIADLTTGGAAQSGAIQNGYSAYIIVTTDSSGIVEWAASNASTTTLNMEAYW